MTRSEALRVEAKSRKAVVAINITPLVDVLLVLLIILMLAVPLFVKKLPVDVPKTSLSGPPVAVKSLPVSLAPNGTLLLKNSPSTLREIKALITPATTVEISADKAATYDKVATLVADLQDANPKEILLVTR